MSYKSKNKFLFILVFILVARMAHSQDGLVKTIQDFSGDLGQYAYVKNKLVFTELRDGIFNEFLWSYDLESKEIELIHGSIEHSGSGFFVFENYILFNTNGHLVLYDVIATEYDTISKEENDFMLSDLQEAVILEGIIYFTAERNLWKFDTGKRKLDMLEIKGRIIGHGTEHIYTLSADEINVYNTSSGEVKNVIPQSRFSLIRHAIVEESLIFLHSPHHTSTTLKRYDTKTQTTVTFEVPIGKVNDNNLYIFHKVNNQQLIFNDRAEGKFWLYDSPTNQLIDIELKDIEGNTLNSYGQFASNDHFVYFGGSNSGNSAIIKYDLEADQFTNVVTFPQYYEAVSYELNLFNDSIMVATVSSFMFKQNLFIDINLKTGSIDTIAEIYPNRQLFFKNSVLYNVPETNADPHKIYRYNFSTKRSDLVEGSYFPTDNSPVYPDILTQYKDSIAFIWDNRNTLMTIDDSYRDSLLNIESCEYYLFLDDSITQSGNYRKKIDGDSIDTVINLLLEINHIELGVSTWSSSIDGNYWQAHEENGDTYQWINCDDYSVIPNETNFRYYPTDDEDYGVIITKGSCIDTTGCPLILGVTKESLPTFSIYPNPTNKPFVTLESEFQSNFLEIRIFSISGKLLMNYYSKNIGKMNLNIPKEPGFYILLIIDGSNEYKSKIINL